MTDARRLHTVRSWLQSLSLAQEVIVLAGVALFLGGLATSSPSWRAVLFSTSVVLISMFVVSAMRRKAGTEPQSTGPERAGKRSIGRRILGRVRSEHREYDASDFVETPEVKEPTGRTWETNDSGVDAGKTEAVNQPGSVEDAIDDQEGPRAEFTGLLSRILGVIKETTFAHSVCIFWVNQEKRQLVLENHVTSSRNFFDHRRLELANDLVSQVAVGGTPKIVNYLNQKSLREMLPYYQGEESVRTFVGVPVYLSGRGQNAQKPVAVLTVDCLEDDAYGEETMALLARFTKLIASLTRSYTDKYDMLLDSEVLRSIMRLREGCGRDLSATSIARGLADETSRLVPWDYVAVVIYDETRKAWVVQHVSNRMGDAYVPASSEVDAHHSLVGAAIQANTTKIVDHVAEMSTPRFYQAERCESRGSIVVVPLASLGRSYGALVVESKDQRSYSESDIVLLQKISETAAWALEILSLTEIMNHYVSLDETTGVSTRRHFLERLTEEVQRSNDFGTDLAVVLVCIDRMADHVTRRGQEAFNTVLQSVGRMIKASVRGYDVVGRYDADRFAVLLVNTTANEASLWAEKIRRNVASTIVNVDNKSFSVTVSMGVAGATTEIGDLELLEHADRVLGKAVEAGGNLIRVY